MTEHSETKVETQELAAEATGGETETTAAENNVADTNRTEENAGDSAAVSESTAEASGMTDSPEASAEANNAQASAEANNAQASAEANNAQASAEANNAQASAEANNEEDEDGPVVKMLSVGQQVKGLVRRITDFGAFVDIGVGRDGLIHVSELSVRRVGKVTDVLQENQEIDVWIKKLDRERNRISLTMIEPGTKTIRELEKGELVSGTVTRILPYGAFIDIGIGRDALLHIREMSEGFVARPEDVVSVGEELEARVIELSRRRQRVDLSIKGLRPEPEVELPPEAAAEAAAEESAEEEVVDEFADVEVLSPMELAFKRAMEAEGIELSSTTKDGKKKRKKGKRGRSVQDEIIARTLGVANN